MLDENKELEIKYNGSKIGTLIRPRIDNFDLYGCWCSNMCEAYDQFISKIEKGEVAIVEIGEKCLKGSVEVEPDDEIEIKIRPGN